MLGHRPTGPPDAPLPACFRTAMPRVSHAPRGGGWGLFERRHHRLLSGRDFARRMLRSLGIAAVLVAVSLLAGIAGYRMLEGRSWEDAYLNAAMLLSGMGPLWAPQTTGGKVFAGLYALYCGLAVLAIAGVVVAPLIHRMLHHFHADEDAPDSEPATSAGAGPRPAVPRANRRRTRRR
jgi:hypothetical protein